ncbi:MAG TPA: SDR family NAD(P)-dependent oxidoreductase [Rhodanobacteraceae bacterium]|nr:SDR family NAD(P)-dependent oxidoreductase [Rhodanobacteraceae bacterium]
MQRRALIAGAGGSFGTALVRRFTQAGYAVDAIVRRPESIPAVGTASTIACDLTVEATARPALERLVAQADGIDVLVFNVATLVTGSFEKLARDDFDRCFQASVGAAVTTVQAVLPCMLRRGAGAILFSGATASIRGSSGFAAFAAAKFALRGLAQSLAREHQPHGIHVAHVLLDGLLRGSASVTRFGANAAKTLDVDEVAKTYVWLAEQPRSAWTHELDLRHHEERF